MAHKQVITCSTIQIPSGPSICFTGPPLSHGKMPALFYFALSGQASLCTDPYNQPAVFLSGFPIRVYSITLPGHEQESQFVHAIKYWAQEISLGNNIIHQFAEQVRQAIDYLVEHGWIDVEKIAVAGLSRGGFIAAHVAAQDPRIKLILGFAPLTKLTYAKEFADLREHLLAQSLDLQNLIQPLIGRPLRFYIGNRDVRVGTENCFKFIMELAEASFACQIRSAPAELIITSSQGQYGHGTLPHVFQEGISWLSTKLQIVKD